MDGLNLIDRGIHMSVERPLRILALDGGGVRDLSEVLILKRIMNDLQLYEEQ